MKSSIRIYLISDNALTAETLGAVLSADPGFDLAGASGRFGAALETLPEVDLVLIDATRRAREALALARDLAETRPTLKVVPLELEDPQQVLDFLEAGASGYVMKDASLADVTRTLRDVAAGRPPCSPRVAALVFRRIVELSRRVPEPRETAAAEVQALSCRERQVLRLLAGGLRNKEIAQRLGIALSTAGNHVQQVLDKLAVHRRRDAIRRAYEHGLLEGIPLLTPVS